MLKLIVGKLKDNFKGTISLLMFVLFILYWTISSIKERENEIEYVHKNYKSTKGHITDCWIIGNTGARGIDYSYSVDSNLYTNTVTSTYYYEYFEKDKIKCSKMQFWVIYSVDDPSKSLIDLSREIQGIENPRLPGPKDLDSFE